MSASRDPAAPGRDGPRDLARGHRAWMWFFTVVIAVAGVAFAFKLYEFFYDLTSTPGFEFTGAHLLTYLLVAGGFFLLLAFSFLRGHFANVEQAKFDLLDLERAYDRAEFEDR